jgi:hypothetical protein
MLLGIDSLTWNKVEGIKREPGFEHVDALGDWT